LTLWMLIGENQVSKRSSHRWCAGLGCSSSEHVFGQRRADQVSTYSRQYEQMMLHSYFQHDEELYCNPLSSEVEAVRDVKGCLSTLFASPLRQRLWWLHPVTRTFAVMTEPRYCSSPRYPRALVQSTYNM